MTIKKVGFPILLILIGLALLGYVHKNSHSFFSDSTCNPPCWETIYPGVTTEEETLVILKGLSNIDQKNISTHGSQWVIFDDIIYFQSTPKNWDGYAYILNHKVTLLDFNGNLNINFRDVIKENGNPKFVINVPTHGGGIPGIPTVSYSITVLDPDKGIAYTFNTNDLPMGKHSELRPDTPISMITYFDPDSYNDLLDAKIFSMSFLGREETLKYLHPWTGFGSIEKKYPPAVIK
jgi:hypothetical protein